MKENTPFYDIIGDVHGHAELLKKLLKKLNYELKDGVWQHKKRKAVFVGDFINRGPQIRETLEIVRGMVEAGTAYAILGNHEYAAILYHIKDSGGTYLGRHISGNRNQISKTLSQFKNEKELWKDYLRWLRTLPLFLDLGEIRVAHAYWNDAEIDYLKEIMPADKLKKRFLREIHENGHPASEVVYHLLKGLEYRTPADLIVKDTRGMTRRTFRMNWWESPSGKTFRSLSFGNKFVLPDYSVPQEIVPRFEPYSEDQPPVFFGHYCLSGCCAIPQSNLCCVDSCVATTGKLMAYRWKGEKTLTEEHLISVKD
ncbi:metallophosphoesterase [Prolixibacter denitrificans]|uniref:Calcineurin-like phosphoesterase family protein n=1 Tax=Prolixibacter denitrificans TaxID=1541063 RepID=A0A2P8C9V7_9BACT|nr:metallophosphoesterase [Prolixibacter denitrificans]PSK81734.1 calcineurin-like phosphoesterase family protein [Prolixibacter denitrificans]GET21255.1 diadenosine tetraphosphatase [Prolixibacter denitrificans]